MSKKITLVIIIITELIVGGYLLTKYIKKQSAFSLQPKLISAMDKKNILQKPTEEFLYYYELKPNKDILIQNDWLKEGITYRVNSDGLNDIHEYQYDKPNNTYRILALGDSLTFGEFVNTVDSWPKQLELMLNSDTNCIDGTYEVINLGMRGFDIKYLVERYRLLGSKYNPDLIVWFESRSGFSRNLDLMMPLIEKCQNDLDTNQLKTQESIKEKYYHCWFEATKFIEEEKMAGSNNSMIEASLNDFFQLVDQSKVYFITFQKASLKTSEQLLFDKWKLLFSKAKFSASVPYLNGEEVLPDGHPSVAGHRIIAKSISETLISDGKIQTKCK